jgi:hypothetical protein
MARILWSSTFRISKPLPQLRSETRGIARRSSGRFQLQQAITFDPCIVAGIRGYLCVRIVEILVLVPSIHQSDRRFVAN